MKILVEVRLGLGDVIETTPLCHALHLLGHDVDLYLNIPRPDLVAPLFMDWPVLGRIHTCGDDIDYATYNLGICTRGYPSIKSRFPIGLSFCIQDLEINYQSHWLTERNLKPARLLGYEGQVPSSHVQASSRNFGLPEGAVVVHAGCDRQAVRKRWAHWPEICARLESLGRHVVIVGTEDDRSKNNWETLFHPKFNLPLPDLAALLNQAAFFLGNDSGVGHLAAAVGLPGLLLFGPSDHEIFRPNSRVMRVLATAPDRMQPEGFRPYQSDINLLQVNQVWNEIEELLKDPSRDPARQLPSRPSQSARMAIRHRRTRDDAARYMNAAQMLEYVFSVSADRLMRGRHWRTVARIAERRAGYAHIMQSYQLLKLQLMSIDKPSSGMIIRGRYHAKCGILAGYLASGYALRHAIWIVKKLSFLPSRLSSGANWLGRALTRRGALSGNSDRRA